MTVRKAVAIPVLGAFLLLGLAACEPEGPAERAGEKMDNAAENAGEQMEDVGDAMKDTAD